MTQIRLTGALDMPQSFEILKSPSIHSKARLFLTSPDAEYQFLKFSKGLSEMKANLNQYSVVTSMSGKV